MRWLFILTVSLLVPFAGTAQASDIKDVVFSELERRAIEKFYGRSAMSTEDWRRRHHEAEHELYDHDDVESGGGRGWGRGHPKGKGHGKGKHKHKGLPPGLAKRGGNLPPGLAKRGGHLPPGLAKRTLPQTLSRELPPPPNGMERVIVDEDVVLIETATGIVFDVLYGVVTGQR